MRPKRFYRRRFLNRRGHHAGAYVLAECKIETYDGRREVDAFLTIADCSRLVTLDFSGRSASELANALVKARTLRDTIGDLTAALEGMAEDVRSPRSRG